MPNCLPVRKNGAKGYLRDSPLTKIGVYEATLVGEALREKNITIEHVYCSPSFRCIQTCDGLLRGLNKKNELKIKVEPGLFEWLVWYPDGLPDWMTVDELKKAGYNIDETYQPYVTEKELSEGRESCEQFYLRSTFVARSSLATHATGNILLVGHAATLEVCSREIIGKKARVTNEMTRIIQRVPYCSLLHLSSSNESEEKWEIVEPPCPPTTHSTNQRFDWKILLQ